MTTHLLIIDPQNDFCDGPAAGNLAVPGAWDDMRRLAGFIDREAGQIDAITVTLDSHHHLDIGHPAWWRMPDGSEPAPFTIVTAQDVTEKRITPAEPWLAAHATKYLEILERQGRFVHTIWPTHCLLGTPGHAIQPDLMTALNRWSASTNHQVNFVLKGMNPLTEHYSAIRAEVPDPHDQATATNMALVERLMQADRLVVAGEALSHCVKATVEDYVADAEKRGLRGAAKRISFLTDAMSPVPAIPDGPDFPSIGAAFLTAMQQKGATLSTTACMASFTMNGKTAQRGEAATR